MVPKIAVMMVYVHSLKVTPHAPNIIIIKGGNDKFSVYKPWENHLTQWSKLPSPVMRQINTMPPDKTQTEGHSITSVIFLPTETNYDESLNSTPNQVTLYKMVCSI